MHPASLFEAETDRELQAALDQVRPSPDEILSLWPAGDRRRLVLSVRVDAEGRPEISARMRERTRHAERHERQRTRRRSDGGVPIVVELPGGRTTVVSWRAARNVA